MLRKGLAAMGGLEPLIPGRQGVLIKPNLVLREPAGIPDYPTMSSPDTIRELTHLVRSVSDDVLVGDQGEEDVRSDPITTSSEPSTARPSS